MNEITAILFIASLCLFVVSYVVKKNELNWLTFFMSTICAIYTVMDETMDDTESLIFIAPMLFVLLISGLRSWGVLK